MSHNIKAITPSEAVAIHDPNEWQTINTHVVKVNAFIREKIATSVWVDVPFELLGTNGRIRHNVLEIFRKVGWNCDNKVGTSNYTFKQAERKPKKQKQNQPVVVEKK
jgi:hypothetical protein